jgi:hypothetical protein
MKSFFKRTKILPQVKLKHLNIVGSEDVDYSKAMTEIAGYKNTWLSKRIRFVNKFSIVFLLIAEIRKMDISKIEESKDCKIKRPVNIDFICFQAFMELQAQLSGEISGEGTQGAIAKAIATATYESNNEDDYKGGESKEFLKWQNKILNQPLTEMMGLFNWITKSLEESITTWNERFSSVSIDDPEYDQAGGDRMGQFNVINTIKGICTDFNVPFKEAWLMSYNLVQSNNYAQATASRIQDDMRIYKEVKLKAQQRQ